MTMTRGIAGLVGLSALLVLGGCAGSAGGDKMMMEKKDGQMMEKKEGQMMEKKP